MALTKYSYTKNVNSDKLTREIVNSAIVTALSHIDTAGTALDVWFDDALSGGDETILNGLVTAHVPVALRSKYQIWESNPDQTTLLQTWQTAFSRQSDPLKQGPYILRWYAEIRVNPVGPIDSRAAVQFRIDTDVKGSSINDANRFIPFSGWDRFIAVAGSEPTLDIQYRRDPGVGGNDEIVIRKLKMSIQGIR